MWRHRVEIPVDLRQARAGVLVDQAMHALGDLRKDGPFPRGEPLRLLQIARALQHPHERAIASRNGRQRWDEPGGLVAEDVRTEQVVLVRAESGSQLPDFRRIAELGEINRDRFTADTAASDFGPIQHHRNPGDASGPVHEDVRQVLEQQPETHGRVIPPSIGPVIGRSMRLRSRRSKLRQAIDDRRIERRPPSEVIATTGHQVEEWKIEAAALCPHGPEHRFEAEEGMPGSEECIARKPALHVVYVHVDDQRFVVEHRPRDIAPLVECLVEGRHGRLWCSLPARERSWLQQRDEVTARRAVIYRTAILENPGAHRGIPVVLHGADGGHDVSTLAVGGLEGQRHDMRFHVNRTGERGNNRRLGKGVIAQRPREHRIVTRPHRDARRVVSSAPDVPVECCCDAYASTSSPARRASSKNFPMSDDPTAVASSSSGVHAAASPVLNETSPACAIPRPSVSQTSSVNGRGAAAP